MQEIINEISQFISLNSDAVVLAFATGIAAILILILKAIFTFAEIAAGKTYNTLDDKIVKKVKEVLKNKMKNF